MAIGIHFKELLKFFFKKKYFKNHLRKSLKRVIFDDSLRIARVKSELLKKMVCEGFPKSELYGLRSVIIRGLSGRQMFDGSLRFAPLFIDNVNKMFYFLIYELFLLHLLIPT